MPLANYLAHRARLNGLLARHDLGIRRAAACHDDAMAEALCTAYCAAHAERAALDKAHKREARA